MNLPTSPLPSFETAYELALADDLEVREWRHTQMRRLGFDEVQADLLVSSGADWHEVERLLARGCPHSLVLQLLT